MSFGSRGYGHGFGADDPRSNGYRTGSYYQGSSHGIRNPGPVPANADTTTRRRSMNIEDMLNPSDESPGREQQPQSPQSYKTVKTPKPGALSYKAKASSRSQGGSRPSPRGGGSGSPDMPSRTRAFRPGYTDEQELFIWYLRIDVRIS